MVMLQHPCMYNVHMSLMLSLSLMVRNLYTNITRHAKPAREGFLEFTKSVWSAALWRFLGVQIQNFSLINRSADFLEIKTLCYNH